MTNQFVRYQKRTPAGNGKQLFYLEWPKCQVGGQNIFLDIAKSALCIKQSSPSAAQHLLKFTA